MRRAIRFAGNLTDAAAASHQRNGIRFELTVITPTALWIVHGCVFSSHSPVRNIEERAALWPGMGYGEVVIDFNHNTVPGHESYRGEPAPIAARAAPRVIPGEGLVFENIQRTPDGVAYREHYPDLSPAVALDDAGEVIFCHSAALARNGAVKDLHLCSATARRTSPNINEDERHVMRLLNISEASWRKAGS